MASVLIKVFVRSFVKVFVRLDILQKQLPRGLPLKSLPDIKMRIHEIKMETLTFLTRRRYKGVLKSL